MRRDECGSRPGIHVRARENGHGFVTAFVRERLPRPLIRTPDRPLLCPPDRASCRSPWVMLLDEADRSFRRAMSPSQTPARLQWESSAKPSSRRPRSWRSGRATNTALLTLPSPTRSQAPSWGSGDRNRHALSPLPMGLGHRNATKGLASFAGGSRYPLWRRSGHHECALGNAESRGAVWLGRSRWSGRDLMRPEREATGPAEWIACPAEELRRGRWAGLVGVWVLGAASGGVPPRAARRQRRRAHPGCCAG